MNPILYAVPTALITGLGFASIMLLVALFSKSQVVKDDHRPDIIIAVVVFCLWLTQLLGVLNYFWGS